jgi:hypothetical protein
MGCTYSAPRYERPMPKDIRDESSNREYGNMRDIVTVPVKGTDNRAKKLLKKLYGF